MQFKHILGACLLIMSIVALPFVTVAKSSKRQANGVLVCECCGQKKCDCCNEPSPDVGPVIAECGFTRPMRVATMANNRPFGWAEWVKNFGADALTSRGFGVNMFEEIAKKLKLKYKIVGYQKDQDAVTDLKRGNLDLLIGIYTPATMAGKNTTPVYPAMFSNLFTVYYLKDKAFEVTGYESLHNKIGVIRRVENIYPLFSPNITEDMTIMLETTESAFKKLLSGEADYLIGSPYSIEAELRRYKLHNKIVPAKKVLFNASMFMILTRATDCFKLRDILGAAVEEYNADPHRANKEIRKVIDAWGELFRDAPGLVLDSDAAADTKADVDLDKDSDSDADVTDTTDDAEDSDDLAEDKAESN